MPPGVPGVPLFGLGVPQGKSIFNYILEFFIILFS
jgi:hypothetical protein